MQEQTKTRDPLDLWAEAERKIDTWIFIQALAFAAFILSAFGILGTVLLYRTGAPFWHVGACIACLILATVGIMFCHRKVTIWRIQRMTLEPGVQQPERRHVPITRHEVVPPQSPQLELVQPARTRTLY